MGAHLVPGEPVTLWDLDRGDWARFTYPDGTVLVARYEDDRHSARNQGVVVVTLWINSIGIIPVDVAGTTVERLKLVSENG